MSFLNYIFGSFSDKQINDFKNLLDLIEKKETFFTNKSDEDFREMMLKWKYDYRQGKSSLDDLLIDVFSAVREAGKRVWKKRLFDSQMTGAYMLHKGYISEMKTGEGKTLVSAPVVILNAITEKPIHVVTVNDYLAQRDAEIISPLLELFGLSSGYVVDDTHPIEKKKAYKADVTFCSNNQIAFDYLRDNMVTSMDQKVQRGLHFAIIDEIDNILIDEARTPLIISDTGDEDAMLYQVINPIIYNLKQWQDYELDFKHKNVYLTKEGAKLIEEFLLSNGIIDGSLYESKNVSVYHVVINLLRAHKAMECDKDYIVRGNEIIIIDEFTGRLANGRRFSNGLHQAIEAKEQVDVKPESVTRASITYTNFFRLYDKVSGMTGTASSEEDEFAEIYNLKIVKIPTNKPLIRYDHPEILLYRHANTLNEDLIAVIKEKYAKKQPILICTPSVAYSEVISLLLEQASVPHNLLNAKNNEKEAYMIAQAGRPGAVTVSTNMAGRGTDIMLGGSLEMAVKEVLADSPGLDKKQVERRLEPQFNENYKLVKSAGGLCVLIVGTTECEKAELQFMGRAGRQGDPGETYRYYCLEDSLLGSLSQTDPINRSMLDFYFPESKRVHTGSRVFEVVRQVQLTYQSSYFELRKNILKYDDVLNTQRKVAYEFRDFVMCTSEINELIVNILNIYLSKNKIEDLQHKYKNTSIKNIDEIVEFINNSDDENLRSVVLNVFDRLWYIHIIEMDNLKKTIHLLSYEQKDPVQEFKKKAYEAFVILMDEFAENTIMELYYAGLRQPGEESSKCICGSEKDFFECHGKDLKHILESDSNDNNGFSNFLNIMESIDMSSSKEEEYISQIHEEIKSEEVVPKTKKKPSSKPNDTESNFKKKPNINKKFTVRESRADPKPSLKPRRNHNHDNKNLKEPLKKNNFKPDLKKKNFDSQFKPKKTDPKKSNPNKNSIRNIDTKPKE